MKTQAYFENIQEVIIKEISLAETSIKVAVAWLTDVKLYDLLCKKSREGIIVELILMDDKINRNSSIDYSILSVSNGKVWKIKQSNNNQPIMHNKFCIIDNKTIINGSYNWTIKAQKNQESITVVKESPDFGLDFVQEFENLKKKYFDDYSQFERIDYNSICIRLETIKNVILLEDIEDIEYQISKLKSQLPKNSTDDNLIIVFKILEFTLKQNYGESVSLINTFISNFRTLTAFIDPEVAALKLEMRALEIQIASLEDERSEMEKMIYTFEVKHDKILGAIILQILELKKKRLQKEKIDHQEKESEYAEAEKDFNNYNETYTASLKNNIQELTTSEQDELKLTFRKASKLCHPDIVADEQKEMAQKVFIELKKAYDNSDLKRVKEIYSDLMKGIFVALGDKVNEKQKLLSIVIGLRSKRNEYENSLLELKESITFQEIQQISDLDEYFEEKKKELIEVLKEEDHLTGNKLNNQVEKYSPQSLTKVENKIAITKKILSSSKVEQLKNFWKEKLDNLKKDENWEELSDESDKCIEQLPNWEYGYYRLGTARYCLGDYFGSIISTTRALIINDIFLNAYLNRGIAKDKLGDYHSSIKDYDEVLIIDNEHTDAYTRRGSAKTEIGNYLSALDDLNKSIELDNCNAKAYCFRGLAKIKINETKSAMEDFDKAIELGPNEPDIYIIRAYHRERILDIEGALADKLKADELKVKSVK